MNKGFYYYRDQNAYLWYKTWENFSENSGATLTSRVAGYEYRPYFWSNLDLRSHTLVGAACLAQW